MAACGHRQAATGLVILVLLVCPAVASAEEAGVRTPSGSFTIGAGFGSLEGFIGYAGLGQSRLFGVDGLSLNVDARLSAHRFNTALKLGIEPRALDPLFIDAGAYLARQSLDGIVLGKEAGGWLKLGLKLSPRGSWRIAAGYRIAQLSEQSQEHQQVRLLSVPFLELSYRSPEMRADPSSGLALGLLFNARVEHTGPWTGSDLDMTRIDLRLHHGLELPWGLVLQTRAHAGLIQSSKNHQVPLLHRYRLGHALADESALPLLGPVVATTGGLLSLGGTGILHGQAALHVPILRRYGLYAVAGLEAGAILSPDMPGERFSASAAGLLGLYWNAPIGPIGAGVGLPFSAGSGCSRSPRLMLSIGGRF